MKEILFYDKNINRTFCTTYEMVPEGIKFALVKKSVNLMLKGAI